tara:strand:- start:233 stop:631 length:399 start_codon:yes stop_codon:yes gene_type:complete
LISLALSMTGCASSSKAMYNPNSTPTMGQIYQSATNANNQNSLDAVRGVVASGDSNNRANYAGLSTVESKGNINQTFPLLPNPEITLYVYPHLAGSEEVPVPGYTTAFFMYNKQHFALPGEVASKGNVYYAG